MEKRLKECPFCGGEAELKQTGRMQLTIKCKSCLIKKVQKVLRYSLDWLEEKMIEDWNTRLLCTCKKGEYCELCASSKGLTIPKSED